MWRSVRWYILGSVALVALAGCGRSWFAEREPWRHDAELQCLKSGAVKEGAGVVMIKPIEGPGVCGADFPLRITALGSSAPLSFGEDVRPPGAIPGAQPPWPIAEPRFGPASAGQAASMPAQSIEARPLGQPAYGAPRYSGLSPTAAPRGSFVPESGAPLSLTPNSLATEGDDDADRAPYDFRKPYASPDRADPIMTRAPFDPGLPMPAAPHIPLGPARGPQYTGAVGPVAVSPAATLACPMVSVLDRWITETVQPAALHWFGQPVTEIKQISAYSCRGMNGQPGAHISEHAFGNALDVAAFTFADGRTMTVQNGWHGLPEEQGFLRDVQGGACQDFTTVLAPGYNVFHYNHIHVDLMRRHSGHIACQPKAVPGEVVAAQVRARFAGRQDPSVTGSIALHRLPSPPRRLARLPDDQDDHLPRAIPGEEVDDDDD